jgi:preprotein translocase subunit YajC
MNPAAAPNPIASFVPLIAMVAIFYFLVIRPQQKQAKEHDAMLAALKKGDRVLTNGGFYVTIMTVRGSDLEVLLGDSKVVMARSAVSRLANHPELASTAASAEKA